MQSVPGSTKGRVAFLLFFGRGIPLARLDKALMPLYDRSAGRLSQWVPLSCCKNELNLANLFGYYTKRQPPTER